MCHVLLISYEVAVASATGVVCVLHRSTLREQADAEVAQHLKQKSVITQATLKVQPVAMSVMPAHSVSCPAQIGPTRFYAWTGQCYTPLMGIQHYHEARNMWRNLAVHRRWRQDQGR